MNDWMVHNWQYHDGYSIGILFSAYLNEGSLSSKYLQSYFEINQDLNKAKFNFDLKTTPTWNDTHLKTANLFGPIWNLKENAQTELPETLLFDFSSHDYKIATKNLLESKLNLALSNYEALIEINNSTQIEISLNFQNEITTPKSSKSIENTLIESNLFASIVKTFGNVTYESEDRKHYKLNNIETYNFISPNANKNVSCFYENGYNLLYVCQLNSTLCEKILGSWLNLWIYSII